MHGMYRIKVQSRYIEAFEYTAPCHPAVNDLMTLPNGDSMYVSSIRHHLKNVKFGNNTTTVLDYVELEVFRSGR